MVDVRMTQNLNAPPEAVWALVGGFFALTDFHPLVAVVSPEEGGMVRRIEVVNDGGTIWERLLHYDAAARTYRYAILRHEKIDLAFTNYRSSLAVKDGPRPGTAVLEWRGAADLLPGAREADATGFIETVYRTGMEALAQRFGAF